MKSKLNFLIKLNVRKKTIEYIEVHSLKFERMKTIEDIEVKVGKHYRFDPDTDTVALLLLYHRHIHNYT